MNIERAQRHMERAHDLLGFGMKQNLESLDQDLREEIEKHLPVETLSILDQTSSQTRSIRLAHYNKLRQGWIWNDEEVMDNAELVRAACSVDPHAFGYASERLQKNKELSIQITLKIVLLGFLIHL